MDIVLLGINTRYRIDMGYKILFVNKECTFMVLYRQRHRMQLPVGILKIRVTGQIVGTCDCAFCMYRALLWLQV